ncbi:helix-turn-helix domain-containing protein [Diaphorobacter sp.]|uniref:helix-turn-helix domain-containing protein n=1 Tax=Diaphorobacter sp. TaxID=1934310 RepID=UPI0028AB5E19|nr:helix-turn-helix domain-containing protein [Diaphorobacter sp.]
MLDAKGIEVDRVRLMAEKLDCFLEEDFQELAMATPITVEAWRKRGRGPAYILLGNRYLYPRKAVAKYLEEITRERHSVSAKEAL